jgi:predicted dehydrogenase
MGKIGAAVVGTGFIGPVHVEAIRRLGHHVVGILGSSPEKSRRSADSLGLEKAYPSLAELLADPAVAVVHLASPNRHHYSQCQQVLAAGKHLICEKPLAATRAETADLVRLAAQTPVITAVNYNIRFYPLCLEARELIRSGSLGSVFHITGSYLQDWLLYPTDFNWRVLAEEGGELRAVADIGTHWLDLITFITGLEVEAVCADLSTVHPIRQRPRGGVETFQNPAESRGETEAVAVSTEDYGSILLRFRGGVKGCLSVSQVTAGRKNALSFEIATERASLAWHSEEPNTLQLGTREHGRLQRPRDPGSLAANIRSFSNYPAGHAEGFPDSFKQLYRAVYTDIERGKPSGEPLYATFTDGHREVCFCDAVLRSHREQRWVMVDNA